MPLQGSGNIALSQIASEFSDSSPHQLTEFYRNGSLVPSTKTVTGSNVTVTNTNITTASHANRGLPYTHVPQFNTGGLYKHVLWADNGNTGYLDVNFTIPTTGTYSWSATQWIGNDYGVRGIFTMDIGSLRVLNNHQLPNPLTGTSGSFTVSNTANITAGTVVTLDFEWNSGGWAGNYFNFGGSSTGNRTPLIQSDINTNVPTSGNINMTNFYSAEDT